MTIRDAVTTLAGQLHKLYDEGEALNIANMVLERVTGCTRSEMIVEKNKTLGAAQQEQLRKYAGELLTHKPVQYVLGEAWFMNMRFRVTEDVLIPRPETEELVDLVIKNVAKESRILDVGTGSGCIAVALKKYLPRSEVYAVDISEKALTVAMENASANNVEKQFSQVNILDEAQWGMLPAFDVIVSNPPYIPVTEKSSMAGNVVNFEPHTALFVPDSDPLIFYKTIGRFAESKSHRCKLFFEIHESMGNELRAHFNDYHMEIKKDLQGKERMMMIWI
jgi:release factor glutamine methyltransferase